jgi:hypothetical protein
MQELADGSLKITSRTWKFTNGLDRRRRKPDCSSTLGQRSLEEIDHGGRFVGIENVDA